MPTHVGLIGGGNISETHARAALANADVAISAIYGTNMQNVERLARDYGGKAFTDYNAFLAHKPMDLVMIGSPSGLHAQQGIDHVAERREPHASTQATRQGAVFKREQSGALRLSLSFLLPLDCAVAFTGSRVRIVLSDELEKFLRHACDRFGRRHRRAAGRQQLGLATQRFHAEQLHADLPRNHFGE